MAEAFDVVDYLARLKRRWKVFAAAAVAAGTLGSAVSAVLPREYETRVTLVVDLGEAAKSQVLPLMSPSYLESLDTFAQFALNQELFERAAKELQLPELLEKGQEQVIEAEVLSGTRALEIRVTWTDPEVSLRLARFIGEGAVELSRETAQHFSGSGTRALPERLVLVDRGVLPRRPVRPKPVENVLAALLFSLVFSLIYVTVTYGWSQRASRRPGQDE